MSTVSLGDGIARVRLQIGYMVDMGPVLLSVEGNFERWTAKSGADKMRVKTTEATPPEN